MPTRREAASLQTEEMASGRQLCSLNTFRWSEDEVTLKELGEFYGRLLPFPILITKYLVTEGEGFYSVREGDVFWAHAAVDNTWIIVRDQGGRRYKIPQNYDATILPIKQDGTDGFPFPFRNVREHGGYRYIKFISPSSMTATDLTTSRRYDICGQLEVVDVYDETFIVIHHLHMECLLDELNLRDSKKTSDGSVVPPGFAFLPSDTPIYVVLGVALRNAPETIYFHTMAEIKSFVDKYPHNYAERTCKILLESVTPSGDDYEYVQMYLLGCKQPGKSNLPKTDPKPYHDPVADYIDPNKRLEDLRRFYDTGHLDIQDQPRSVHPNERPFVEKFGDRAAAGPGRVTSPGPEGHGISWLRNQFEGTANQKVDTSRNDGNSGHKPSSGNGAAKMKRTQLSQLSSERLHSGKTPPPGVMPKPCRRPTYHKQHRSGSESKAAPDESNELHMVLQRRRFLSEGYRSPENDEYIRTTASIPVDVSNFSVDQVSTYLSHLGLSAHVPAFSEAMVDGRLLQCLEAKHLKDEFRLANTDAVRLVQFIREGSRSKRLGSDPAIQ